MAVNTNCAPATGLVAFPGTLLAGDQIVFRWTQVLLDGRRYTTSNAQSTVNPAFTNFVAGTQVPEDNGTANITAGQFYGSPYTFNMTMRTQFAQTAYTGTYTLQQRANWSPAHTNAAGIAMHSTSYPAYMNTVSFPTQTVTIAVPTGGLTTEREFDVLYRGATIKMRLNLEPTNPGLSAAALATLQAGTGSGLTFVPGYGFPAGSVAALGSVFVPLVNTGQSCTAKRQFYWTSPGGGTFGGTFAMPIGTPRSTTPNRGVYSTSQTGLIAGDMFSICVDDDADEYGRRNGYCSWTRRLSLTLTKL